MKITRDTPDQLILENNPIWLAVFISVFALIFIGIGLFLLSQEFWMGVAFTASGLAIGVIFNLVFVRRTQFIFDRPSDLVEMRRRSLLGYSKRTWELAHLSEAVVQSSRSDNTTTYRAALVFSGGMDPGTVPVTIVYSSGSGADRAANAVNKWIRSGG